MKKEKALYDFDHGYNCSQAVIGSFCEEFGMTREQAVKIAVAFGGGVGRQGKMCGCVSGALMILGLRYGDHTIGNSEQRIKNYEFAKTFCSCFIEKHGALDCREIIKYNLDNLEEREQAQKENAFKNKCSQVVAQTVELLERFIEENE